MRREGRRILTVKKFQYIDFDADTSDTGRIYHSPSGDYPSITTILGKTADKKWLHQWRARIGEKEANRISKESADQGTKVHGHMENHFSEDKEVDLTEATEREKQMFQGLRLYEKKITAVYGLEVPLYSPSLGYAGRCDLVGEWEGTPAIVDYKTSRRTKKREWITDYFLQSLGYAIAHNEVYDTNIQLGVILIAVADDMPQCFTIDFSSEGWAYDRFGERLAKFYRDYPGGIIK